MAIAAALVRLLATPAARIGDGSEYYALFFAWRDATRPWMTDASWRAYDAVRASGSIAGLVPAELLRQAFAPLHVVGGGTDVHHFWFYSALAATIAKAMHLRGAHEAFLVLAALLLAGVVLAAWRGFGLRGAVAAVALLCLSPAVWFVDKVHTEHFTFCTTTCAVIFFMRRRYAPACLALALASTQNPSFAIVAVVVAVIAAASGRQRRKKLDVALYVLAALTAALHPAYYLLRYGSLSPQLYTGGARLFASARYAWIWLFDLDVGLFASWWLGVVLAVFALVVFRWRARWVVFVGAWLVASLGAQSSTLNLNAGGTFGMSRYGIWYLALFFPVVLALVERARTRPRRVLVLAAFAALYAWVVFRPSLDESGYGRPTPISYAVQRWAPWAYDPPAEIFAERYGGVGESYPDLAGAVAIAGPDCHKVLVLRGGTGRVLGGCNLAVADLVAAHVMPGAPAALPRFAEIPIAPPPPPVHLVLHFGGR